LFIAIMGTLFLVDPVVTIVSMFTFGTTYAAIAMMTRRRLILNGYSIAEEQTHVIKALQEGLGAIRDILLDHTQEVYCRYYDNANQKLRRAHSNNNYINQAPRYIMEAISMVLVAGLAFVMNSKSGGLEKAIPVLGALALGAQRLLPLLQILYGNWSVLAGSKAVLIDVLNLLDQPLPDYYINPVTEPIAFNESIVFSNLYFRYNEKGPWILNDLNIIIKKGSRVGFVGVTGSGKSTALDLMMALMMPVRGKILVDGQHITEKLTASWQHLIAHVPQSIFLTDATIAENIAFGIPVEKIDFNGVKTAADQAHISDFIESRPEGYFALVGERGVRLSGGQRQRIGIARALYKQAKVLIFDEATSALDSETEKAVMEAINGLGKDLTIIMIAHRLSTVRDCDKIIELTSGKISREGKFEELFKENE